jgi:hypothetical protein
MVIGGFFAARTCSVPTRDIPEIWEKCFFCSKLKCYAASFIGGFITFFASRLAGDSTMGLFI